MMVAEEESLKERLLKSIALCRKELDALCRELRLDPFEVGTVLLPGLPMQARPKPQKARWSPRLGGSPQPPVLGGGCERPGASQHLGLGVAAAFAPPWGALLRAGGCVPHFTLKEPWV